MVHDEGNECEPKFRNIKKQFNEMNLK